MKKSSKSKTGAEQLAAAHNLMKDLLAYVLYTLENGEITQERKLYRISAAVGHDLGGFLHANHSGWVPQTRGWAERAEKEYYKKQQDAIRRALPATPERIAEDLRLRRPAVPQEF